MIEYKTEHISKEITRSFQQAIDAINDLALKQKSDTAVILKKRFISTCIANPSKVKINIRTVPEFIKRSKTQEKKYAF